MTASLSTGSQAEAVLDANDLYRFYHAGEDETFALRGVSLTVAPGEILAVVRSLREWQIDAPRLPGRARRA